MTARQIKVRLQEKGITQKRLARRFGVSITAIHFLIHGNLKSRRLERRLARTLGMSVAEFRGEERAA